MSSLRLSELVEAGSVLRPVLEHAQYDADHVKKLVCVDRLDPVRGLAALRLRPGADEPLALLVRLFIGGETLDGDRAAAAVAPLSLSRLQTAGVLERARDGLRACVRLDPLRGIVVASDPSPANARLPRDHVVYPGPAAEVLAALTIRRTAATVLDLCCGSGVQALLAARHAGQVIATDLNPRALRLAALSAALSGIENVAWRQGDLFEPLGTEQFDLIVANPPFVISPTRELMFRDSGRSADQLSREVLQGVAARLRDGGFGHVLCGWVHREGEDWTVSPRRWLQGSGCDAVVLRLDSDTAASYAMSWTSADTTNPAEAAQHAASWVDYYRTLGIERITTALVVLRRRPGPNWLHTDELVRSGRNAGPHLERVFTGHDALNSLPNLEALLERPLQLAPGVSLTQRHQSTGQPIRARLTIDGGIQLPGRITPPTIATALLALHRHDSLADAAAATDVAHDQLHEGLTCIRDLIRRGYLQLK
ncbi:MAG: methyltransferase [Solirubrobacteraceae bacterium]|jgi:SAM-dependent methyltransferase